jgi:protein-S-isoprenylcysteine O-methyltransferase Ste14
MGNWIMIGILLRTAIFLGGSYGIIRMSIPSLGDPRSHGFYRAFAFEVLLALFLVNFPAWLRNPFSPLQIVAWLLLMASAILAAHGFNILRKRGKPTGALETTTLLVTSGIYRLIRHPLYASLLYLGWGMFLKEITVLSAVLVAAASLSIFLTAKAEEAENLSKFGAEYREYMKATRRFIPYVF